MTSIDDDIPPPPDSVIERVAPAFGAAILRAAHASKAATVETRGSSHQGREGRTRELEHLPRGRHRASRRRHLADRLLPLRRCTDLRLGEIEIRR
jgi:hypothetical protein